MQNLKQSQIHFRTLAFLLALVVLGFYGESYSQSLPKNIAWKKLGDDLEVAEVPLHHGIFFTSVLTFIRTELKRYRVGVVQAEDFKRRRANIRSLCRDSKAAVCINANFFDEESRPLGLVMTGGVIKQTVHQGGKTLTGIFQSSRNQVSVINRSAFKAEGVLEAAQAGPRLLANGVPVKGLRGVSASSRRAGVCVDRHNRLIFYCVASGISGVSIEELQNLLLHSDITCVDALNLDGGGSAQMYVSDGIPGASSHNEEIYLPGRDEVPVALGLFLRE